jgi:hypothetical protein
MTFAIPHPLFATPADQHATVAKVTALAQRLKNGEVIEAADHDLVRRLSEVLDRPDARVMMDFLFTTLWQYPHETGFVLLDSGLSFSYTLGISSSLLRETRAVHAPRLAQWLLDHQPNPLDESDILLFEYLCDWDSALVDSWKARDLAALTQAISDSLPHY